MSSIIGKLFTLTTFGESHGLSVGAVVDGCPSKLRLTENDIQKQLFRRRPGQSGIVSPRHEQDMVKIFSGVEKGITLGTPIAMMVESLETLDKLKSLGVDYAQGFGIAKPRPMDRSE